MTGDRERAFGGVLGPGEFDRHDDTIRLVEPDPAWPSRFTREASRIRAALGEVLQRLEHVGSTAVPGLVAKPVLDIVVEVREPGDEAGWVPALHAIGYVLRRREPDWHDHRLLRPADDPRDADPGTGDAAVAVNLHVFPVDCHEVDRMVAFRDRLRRSRVDRELYATAKRRLAARTWPTVQDYADAKGDVVRDILVRAGEGST